MISIHDMMENAFVAERLGGNWIGLWIRDDNHSWGWTDYTPVNYTNWCQGQPAGNGQRFAYLPGGDDDCWKVSDLYGYTHTVCKTPEK